MSAGAALANGAWWLSMLGEAARFRRACDDVEGTQRARLARLLARNADTVYGRTYGFATISTLEEYRARVPLVMYDDLRPHIEAMADGAADVLFPGRATAFIPTSGSTAAMKLIPYNAALRAEFQAGIAPWVAGMFRACPSLIGGPSYWSISPATWATRTTSSGIPIGYDDDIEYLPPLIARLLSLAMAVPSAVARVPDMEAFRYATLLHLLRAGDLRFVSVWHPSFLGLLLAPLGSWGESLVRDLADGTLTPPHRLPAELHMRCTATLRPDPRRARVVADALGGPDDTRTARLWPRLATISCWADAMAAGPARDLAARFPHATIAAKGLLATEGVISIPLPEHAGSALAVRSHVLEFLPRGGDETRFAWELERGGEYEVVISTGGGLYRYRLGDCVRVVGHTAQCPRITFVGRAGRVSDLCGEKLAEDFVVRAIAAAAEHSDLTPGFALLTPDGEGARRYALFLACEIRPSPEQIAALAAALDTALCENPQYAYCRALGQLDSVAVVPLSAPPARAHERYVQALQARGLRTGDIKPAALDQGTDWAALWRAGADGAYLK